jgi:hypothetical protein
MKKLFIPILSIFISYSTVNAQHVSVNLSFPVGKVINPPGKAPFHGAIWIGPEWRWDRGRYVLVPGYWARPQKRNHKWKCGHWEKTRRGYIWVGGRWR